MIQIESWVITLLAAMLGTIGTMVGIYVQLTNKITELNMKVQSLEKAKEHLYERLELNDKDYRAVLDDIKGSIHRIELSIVKSERQ